MRRFGPLLVWRTPDLGPERVYKCCVRLYSCPALACLLNHCSRKKWHTRKASLHPVLRVLLARFLRRGCPIRPYLKVHRLLVFPSGCLDSMCRPGLRCVAKLAFRYPLQKLVPILLGQCACEEFCRGPVQRVLDLSSHDLCKDRNLLGR